MDLSRKHQKTLTTLFNKKAKTIPWQNVESLFNALGGEISRRGGSAIHVTLNGEHVSFHRPHKNNAEGRFLHSMRKFLERAGVSP